MSNLEHLIENGLCRLDEGKSYEEWREIMLQDCNWRGNENITIDNLWEICQYVIFTWNAEPVAHGRWVKVGGYLTPGGDPLWKCSECGKGLHLYGVEHGSYGSDVADGQWVACPNCGAKMDEVTNDG